MRNSPDPIPAYSARLLSPFRYPGGKTWLVPLVCRWLHCMKPRPAEFIEPFAGGGIVGLNVAFRRLAEHVTLVELDEDGAAGWRTIINRDAKRLADRIVAFDLNLDSVNEVLSETPRSLEERAFQTILRNRVSRAGILASGAGVLRNGENGRGIKSRWYPETLKKRILEIDKMRECITFIEGDGLEVLRQYTKDGKADSLVRFLANLIRSTFQASPFQARSENAVFFIDPPYTLGSKRAGNRLYQHHELDHEELFKVASTLTGDFLMTYSNDERVRKLAQEYNFDTQEITMRSSHHAKMTELLIGRDLNWAR